MDPNDLIKAAPEIAKGLTAVGAAIPLTPIIKAFLGDAAAELGQRFGDRVRLYRYGRSLDMLKKAEKMAVDAGYTPKAVPIKLLFPLLEGASLEENEDLHTMWAALLANAASPENATKVRPGFIALLKQMAPEEAAILNALYEEQNRKLRYVDDFQRRGLDLTALKKGLLPTTILETHLLDLLLSVDGLLVEQLITKKYWRRIKADVFTEVPPRSKDVSCTYYLTDRGWAFLNACSPPKPKS